MFMKKFMVLLSIAIFISTVLAYAADDKKPELRPAQKIMQARAASLTAMNKNLEAKNFKAIIKNADEMTAEAVKTVGKLNNPLAKKITLDSAALAKDISKAAAKGDAQTVKTKLGEIKAKCGECHVKIRDKDKN
jgi:cytochrome c556